MSNGVLIVDDHANIRHPLRVFVESKGFEVCGEAENGAEAIEARQLQPDLILLDLTMPVMTGTEPAPILKRTIPHVKIILFTLPADGRNKAVASTVGVDLTLSEAVCESLLRFSACIDASPTSAAVSDVQ